MKIGNIKLAGFEIRKIDRKEMMIGLASVSYTHLTLPTTSSV